MKVSGLLAVTAALMLGGCGSAIVASLDGSAVPQSADVRAHVVAGTLDGGRIEQVSDRTSEGTDATATLYIAKVPFSDIEGPTSAEVRFHGETDGGNAIPGTGRLQAPGAVVDQLLAGQEVDFEGIRYGGGDTFLQLVETGNGFASVKYQGVNGSTGFLGYVVAGEPTEGNRVPTRGQATYTGNAHATVFGSDSGQQNATARANINVDFEPGQRQVTGALTRVRVGGEAANFEIHMRRGRIEDEGYQGRLLLTGVGGLPLVGGTVDSSHYAGAFYGRRAQGTAGTFHLSGSNVPMPGGIEDIEAVGTFGGDRN